jgi:hypothetical protein
MARIRQQYPQNYGSSGNINTEFESVIRYLNAAELGNQTVGELFSKIFDANGNWDGPVEFRKDSTAGIQYRVGEYASESEGWQTLATIAELRGEKGQTVGEIGAPIIFGRADFTATSAQTAFDYSFASTDELLVYVDGVLQNEGALNDYTKDPTGGSSSAGVVTFNTGITTGQIVTVFKIRSTSITGFNRVDTLTTATQINFPFTFDEDTKLQVYKNGILQREGGTNDYTLIPDQNTVQFNTGVPTNNLVTVITVENTSVQAVTGLMFEEDFAHTDSGLLKFDKIKIDDGSIAQAKVSNLVTSLSAKARLTVSPTTPSGTVTGDLWHDTSQVPNQLKFYDGTQWLRTSPDSSLPTFSTGNAGQLVKVNGTGTALEYGTLDLSSVIPLSQKGAANGVAALDSNGNLPSASLPTNLSVSSMYDVQATASNQTYIIQRIYKQGIRIEAISVMTSGGTANVKLNVNGTDYGDIYSASTSPVEQVLSTPIEVDANTSSATIGYTVSGASSAANLEVTLAIGILST